MKGGASTQRKEEEVEEGLLYNFLAINLKVFGFTFKRKRWPEMPPFQFRLPYCSCQSFFKIQIYEAIEM